MPTDLMLKSSIDRL